MLVLDINLRYLETVLNDVQVIHDQFSNRNVNNEQTSQTLFLLFDYIKLADIISSNPSNARINVTREYSTHAANKFYFSIYL